MQRCPIFWEGRERGWLETWPQGKDTVFSAACHVPEGALWCLWAVGEGGELRLGCPEGGQLQRRFSPRMTSPLGRLRRGELRPAQSQEQWQTGECPVGGKRVQEASRLPGAKWRRAGEGYVLSLPYGPGQAFPLVELFCLARYESSGEGGALLFALDRAGEPRLP